MAIYFDTNNPIRSYDRDYVKNIYEQKKISSSDAIEWSITSTVPDIDELILSIPIPKSSGYYLDLATDYIDGHITEDEFYSHIADLYHAKTGGNESMPLEKRQGIFDSIIKNVHNGIICYYTHKNADEGYEVNQGRPMFYYNAEYHYQHEDVRADYTQKVSRLAKDLDLNDAIALFIGEDPLRSINTRLSVAISSSQGAAGRFNDIDIIPPRDMRIAWSSYEEPYEVKLWCGNNIYFSSIPFCYDKQAYKFELSDLLSEFKIDNKYFDAIKNISVMNRQIAQSCPDAYREGLYCLDPRIKIAIESYNSPTIYY